MSKKDKPPGREHSIVPMADVERRIANGWYNRRGCKHYEDRLDWRELLCPACKAGAYE